MSPTLAQNRGYLIRDIKKLIKKLNLSLVIINPNRVDIEKQLLKIESLYSQFAQIDETFIQSLDYEETALKQAEAQAEEVYDMFLEASKGAKSVIEKTTDKADDSRAFQNARLHNPILPKPNVFTLRQSSHVSIRVYNVLALRDSTLLFLLPFHHHLFILLLLLVVVLEILKE